MNRIAILSAAAALLTVAAIAPASAQNRAANIARPSCANAALGQVSCFAEYRSPAGGKRTLAAGARPAGLGPHQLAAAYHLVGARTSTDTVAIVDAYDDPKAEADLAVYRRTYGLPPCTTANGCFRKVNQDGDPFPLPDPDEGWSQEITLDLDAVSAACPTCRILLVEAQTAELAPVAAAEDTAVRLGASVVSNSYGSSEYRGIRALAKHYVHPGTSIVASVGDAGFGPGAAFPAVLRTTIAVGGTTLLRAPRTPRGWRERAWSGSQSACSAYIGKPAWQHDRHCDRRTVADISAVADPETGLAVYDTYFPYAPQYAGWLVAGGTSASAPLIAAMIARSGRPLDNAARIYAHPGVLYDPIGGRSGYCGRDYLCTGKRGYDAPTGMGSPNGLWAL